MQQNKSRCQKVILYVKGWIDCGLRKNIFFISNFAEDFPKATFLMCQSCLSMEMSSV